MKCAACKSKGVIKHEARIYCNKCYCRLIERRIKKYARINKLFSKDDVLCIKNPLLEYLVKQVVKGMPIKVLKSCKKGAREVVFWTLDDENAVFLDAFLTANLRFKDMDGIKLLREVTDKEISDYGKIKGYDVMLNKKPKSYDLAKHVFDRFPLLNYGLSTTVKELKKILK